jgi:hypothetical protein
MQREVAHAPRLQLHRRHFHLEALGDAGFGDPRMPGVHVFHQQVHHEIVGQLRHVEVLQEEGDVAVVKVSQVIV